MPDVYYTDQLQEALDYQFEDLDLLRLALTHRSYSNERGQRNNYERLEFLGDSVLGLVTSHWLYERFPRQPEGELARLKSYLVSAKSLARMAEDLALGASILLGVGEERSGGRSKVSILADTMEALFGAVYLDRGLAAAQDIIQRLLEQAYATADELRQGDPKTVLQEYAQSHSWRLPVYRLVGQEGPDHAKIFTVECWLEGKPAGRAEGGSKKVAERRAAAAALDWIQRELDGLGSARA